MNRKPSPDVAKARGTYAILARHHGRDDPRTVTAETELRAANLAEGIRKAINTWPPLTAEQRDRLAGLLRAGVSE